MPKSQEDATTIEERVAEMIAEHEADPEAHTGENESLAAHRENEVLDHLAGSVVADKFQASGVVMTTHFESLDPYILKGDVSNPAIGDVEFFTSYGSPAYARLAALGSNGRAYVNYATDFMIQFSCMVNSNDLSYMKFRFGQVAESSFSKGLELIVDSTGAKVHWLKTGGEVYSDYFTFSLDEFHTFRMAYIAGEAKLYYYVDGELIGTLNAPAVETSSGGPDFNFWLQSASAGEASAIVEYLQIGVI